MCVCFSLSSTHATHSSVRVLAAHAHSAAYVHDRFFTILAHREYQLSEARKEIYDQVEEEMGIIRTPEYRHKGAVRGKGHQVNVRTAIVKMIERHFHELEKQGKELPTTLRYAKMCTLCAIMVCCALKPHPGSGVVAHPIDEILGHTFVDAVRDDCTGLIISAGDVPNSRPARWRRRAVSGRPSHSRKSKLPG